MSSTSKTSRRQISVLQLRTARLCRVHRAPVHAIAGIFLAGLALILLLPSCGVEFCASVPVLDSISPSSVQAGGPDFTLILKGRHFHSDSSVLWNGFYLFGKTISEHEIQVTVPGPNTLDRGSAQVWVVNDPGGTNLNGPCGGGPSAKLTFTIL